jgi:membrane protein implicated in regulation of membrane protease activity
MRATMQRYRFALLCVAALVGFVAGFLLVYLPLGFMLVRQGRGGHADLGILFAAGAVGAFACSVAAVIATARWIRRKSQPSRDR